MTSEIAPAPIYEIERVDASVAGRAIARPWSPPRLALGLHDPLTPPMSPSRQPDQGWRDDGGKLRLDLMPPEWLAGLGEVMSAGAAKYADRNWEKGMAWSKMVGCGLRHVLAFLQGARFDRETGCHHLAHAAWNLLALMSFDVRGVGADDLPRAKTSPTKEASP